MMRSTWIIPLRRRCLALLVLAAGLGMLDFQVAYALHALRHVHSDTAPTGRLPAADRDCLVLHAGAVPEPPQDDTRPVLPVAVLPPASPERPPAVAAVDAPIARAPPASLLIAA